uniref:Uncharacterized protein n=1 Tax=Romanomermis culicivorax TaxID=13658 RepID=A0A915KP32_ROMCU
MAATTTKTTILILAAFCLALSGAAPSPAAGVRAPQNAVVALYDPSTNTVWVDDGARYAKRSRSSKSAENPGRRASIGLSLAEYMAQPPSSDSFHFLSGKK